MKGIVLSCLIVCCNILCFAQNQNVDKVIFFVDTIEICDPILIKFEEYQESDSHGTKVQTVLVSESSLANSKIDLEISYQNFLLSTGYLFFPANRFSCFLSNYAHGTTNMTGSTLQSQLLIKVRLAAKDTVWVEFDKTKDEPKVFKTFQYHEIYPRKFLLFLVRGDEINSCISFDEISLTEMDNVYIPVLLPITW